MSAYSARLTNRKVTKLVSDLLKELRKKYPAEEFPVAHEQDPKNTLDKQYLAIEAKNIIIAAITADCYSLGLTKNKTIGLPDPADCEAGFQISLEAWWPEGSDDGGVVGLAADKQANVLADVAFTRLMYLANKNLPRADANRLKDLADANDESLFLEQTGPQPLSELEATLPAPAKVSKDFRLSSDWPGYPSAGTVTNEVSNLGQAQYSITADIIFETIKVEVAKAKTKASKAYVRTDNEDARALATDIDAQPIYFPIITAFISLPGNKLCKRAGKNVLDMAHSFAQYVQDEENNFNQAYYGDGPALFSRKLAEIPAEDLGAFYVVASKQYSATKVAEEIAAGGEDLDDGATVNSAATPSLADSASLLGDGDELDTEFQVAPNIDPPARRARGRIGRGNTDRRSAAAVPSDSDEEIEEAGAGSAKATGKRGREDDSDEDSDIAESSSKAAKKNKK
ncbi:hypothetical protein DOTSEDRAFT_53059 [Dothistroma septosporum NZE10]|uniref:Uncharacterized protein n=1 Tax=Dothistroma septosporum (strain NZE10 / CBS 128990) TaxID=675120 RepID=N1PMV2_DOTSN|nr:hypothetical protein DOTSEDRAFT_53059 [Dothistroma septosporum NZE10]